MIQLTAYTFSTLKWMLITHVVVIIVFLKWELPYQLVLLILPSLFSIKLIYQITTHNDLLKTVSSVCNIFRKRYILSFQDLENFTESRVKNLFANTELPFLLTHTVNIPNNSGKWVTLLSLLFDTPEKIQALAQYPAPRDNKLTCLSYIVNLAAEDGTMCAALVKALDQSMSNGSKSISTVIQCAPNELSKWLLKESSWTDLGVVGTLSMVMLLLFAIYYVSCCFPTFFWWEPVLSCLSIHYYKYIVTNNNPLCQSYWTCKMEALVRNSMVGTLFQFHNSQANADATTDDGDTAPAPSPTR